MLTLSLPTRREVTITVVAILLFFVYFNLGTTDDRTRSTTGRSKKTPGSLQSLRDKALGFVLGPTGPDYSREFGARFAKSMELQLARWRAHDQVKLRNVGTARDSREDWGDKIPQTSILTSLPGELFIQLCVCFKHSRSLDIRLARSGQRDCVQRIHLYHHRRPPHIPADVGYIQLVADPL